MKRKLQSFGRQELDSPVSEAIRKLSEVEEKCCGTCEHYKADNEAGLPLNWCNLNNTSTEEEDYCDDYQRD